MKYSNKTIYDFFKNSEMLACPITKCSLKTRDCVNPYVDGIKLAQVMVSKYAANPYGIYATTNYTDSFRSWVCLICENQH